MSPVAVVTEEEGRNKLVSASSPSLDCFSQNGVVDLKERNYLGLSDCSSVDSCDSTLPSLCDEKKVNLNLKATELRLGLPGSQSPERDLDFYSTKLDEKPLFPLLPAKDGIQKTVVSGNKRGFADTVDGFSQVSGLVKLGLCGENYMICIAVKPDYLQSLLCRGSLMVILGLM
jgi:auxin-responsive protein IAA